MKIGIVDVGVGNIGALRGALYSLGWDSERIQEADSILSFDRLIMPGVGSFFESVRRLRQAGLAEGIHLFAASGKPVLGICLGMQLLADRGDEGGDAKGLGLIPGHIRLLDVADTHRLPHVGWNTVAQVQPHPVMKDVKSGVDFYFVHSYFFDRCARQCQFGATEYGVSFPSVVAKGNVVGVQFHPEKSQRNGLRVLDNFCTWSGDA